MAVKKFFELLVRKGAVPKYAVVQRIGGGWQLTARIEMAAEKWKKFKKSIAERERKLVADGHVGKVDREDYSTRGRRYYILAPADKGVMLQEARAYLDSRKPEST